MAHIVFATPPIGRFYLLERLRRDLLRRGHRVSILCTERCRFTFWREQVSDVDLVVPGAAHRRGEAPEDLREAIATAATKSARRRVAQLVQPMQRWLEREQPDLVLFHEERSATARCLHYLARLVGSKVLWTGSGLLPHTMQFDERGLDGDASRHRWSAQDYRVVQPDQALLDASLSHALADCRPQPLPRAEVQVPLLARRLVDAAAYACQGRLQAAITALHGWRAPFGSDLVEPPKRSIDLEPPFVCVLLQRDDDPRLLHDGGPLADARTLVRRTLEASNVLGPDTAVVVVLPDAPSHSSLSASSLAGDLANRVRCLGPQYASIAAATAAATVTISHPLATVALLAGTPVVHTGRALYGADRITTQALLSELPEALTRALAGKHSALRRRFLTWILRHGHVWCSPTVPHYNGMLGLVQAIERCLVRDAECNSRELPYRPGPVWPLATP